MSGSKPGERRGGRQKGTRNKLKLKGAGVAKVTKVAKAVKAVKAVIPDKVTEAIGHAEAEGLMPAEYLLSLVRNTSLPHSERAAYAKACAPYYHPQLRSTEATVTVNKDHVTDYTRAELLRIIGAGAPAGGNGTVAPGSGDRDAGSVH